jgi:hypothetical protein
LNMFIKKVGPQGAARLLLMQSINAMMIGRKRWRKLR